MATPLKRNPNLVVLSREHHDALLLCFKLKQGLKKNIEPQRMADYAKWFWEKHLLHHFKEEETLLFQNTNDALVMQALEDHKILEKLFYTADQNSNFAQMATLLDNHVRFEERVLFPHLEATFSEEKLKKIGEQLSAGNSCMEKYRDEFWL